jgi:hypothetical protein
MAAIEVEAGFNLDKVVLITSAPTKQNCVKDLPPTGPIRHGPANRSLTTSERPRGNRAGFRGEGLEVHWLDRYRRSLLAGA